MESSALVRLSGPEASRCPFRFHVKDVVRSVSSGTVGYVGEGWFQPLRPGYRISYDVVTGDGRVVEVRERDLALVVEAAIPDIT